MGSDKHKPPGPLFVGNFDYEAQSRDVERLLDRYGDVERVDMKMGFAFVYMYDKRDGDDAIKALDGTEWGDRKRRRLKVEWARGDGEVKRREEQRRKQQAPTSTLFVVNFDVTRTRESDLAHEFNKYGRTKRVQIKKNFAFIQYDTVEDAERALKGTHLTNIGGRTISVEYVAREADGRRPWEQPREGSYDRRSDRGGGSSYRSASPRRRSPSRTPPRRRSPSPDYGRRSPGRDGSLDRSRDRSREPRHAVGRDRSRTPPPRRQSPRRSLSRSP